MKYQKLIRRSDLRGNPEALFVFGDNIIRKGYGGQAAEMRGEPNAVGIPTKFSPTVFLSNQDIDTWMVASQPDFLRLINHWKVGGQIIWPEDNIGTGLADLPNKAPVIFEIIECIRQLLENRNLDA
tara:strand:+ start:338 stop:715 length:378 start_codon:yes stop_codon:yes gene_type:complete